MRAIPPDARADALTELAELLPMLRKEAARAARWAHPNATRTVYETRAMRDARHAISATRRLLAEQLVEYTRVVERGIANLERQECGPT